MLTTDKLCLSICLSLLSTVHLLVHSCYSVESYFNASVRLFLTLPYFITISGGGASASWSLGTDALDPDVLCGKSVTICRWDKGVYGHGYGWETSHPRQACKQCRPMDMSQLRCTKDYARNTNNTKQTITGV